VLRSVNGEVRGFLSDRYRRLDSRPIIEAFATADQQKGALPYDGYVTDTKVALQAIRPEVYEPIPGEMVAYGLSLENSEFGNGALSVRAYLLRIWCSNLAITQEEMRQVHLGRRLDESILYSQRTYELDAETTVSALRDVIGSQLNADGFRRRMESVRLAHEQNVGASSARDLLRKPFLTSSNSLVSSSRIKNDAEHSALRILNLALGEAHEIVPSVLTHLSVAHRLHLDKVILFKRCVASCNEIQLLAPIKALRTEIK
jgi:hypothetical protein